jgi:hypothetical protein
MQASSGLFRLMLLFLLDLLKELYLNQSNSGLSLKLKTQEFLKEESNKNRKLIINVSSLKTYLLLLTSYSLLLTYYSLPLTPYLLLLNSYSLTPTPYLLLLTPYLLLLTP